MSKFDFSGWATKANIECTDGRTIMKDAFKHQDGARVSLVWNHDHKSPDNVIGHAMLENREEGVYAYCTFNDTEKGKVSKMLVEHGDVHSLSIYANRLKQNGNKVVHGTIRELSLVLAGANPGAVIDTIVQHSDNVDEEAVIYYDNEWTNTLKHGDELEQETKDDKVDENLTHAEDEGKESEDSEETVEEILDTLNEKQEKAVSILIGAITEELKNKSNDEPKDENNKDEGQGGNDTMKHNVFDNKSENTNVLSHADEEAIIALAKTKSVGSLQEAIEIYFNDESNNLKHGIDEIETLFPEYKDVYPGAPGFIERDQTWVDHVMNGAKKSPISRIRTRQADITGTDLRALGYKKGEKKEKVGNIKLLSRTTDPQTIYRTDALERDDIIDIM